MTVIQKKPDNPIAHLTPEDIEQIGRELDAIRQEVLDTRGADDAAYIRKVINAQRSLELGSRARCCCSARSRRPGSSAPPACPSPRSSRTWRSATTSCTASGTGCATRRSTPPPGSGTTSPGRAVEALAQRDPPHLHQRRRQGQRPRLRHHARRRGPALAPVHLGQPLWNFINACFFEYGIAAYDLELGANHQEEADARTPSSRPAPRRSLRKIRKQATKDYVVHPVLSIPTGSFLPTLAANFTANLVRNLWTHSVIMCGHFPEGVETFEKTLDRGRDPRRVVRAPDARLRQHLRLQGACT